MEEERKHKKADIEQRLGITRPTLEKTMKDCGVDTSNQLHTDSEVAKLEKARQIMDATKSRAKVRDYFAIQGDMKDAKPNPSEQDLWGPASASMPPNMGLGEDSGGMILDFLKQYRAQMGAMLAAAAPAMAAELHDAFNLMVMASFKENYEKGALSQTLELYKNHFEQGGDISQLLAKRQALQSGSIEDVTDGDTSEGETTYAGITMPEDDLEGEAESPLPVQ